MNNIFERTEKKYLLSPAAYLAMDAELASLGFLPDMFGRQEVHNLYFDTEDDRFIRRSVERPFFKEKLRLRSYGLASADTAVYLELKKKYEGVVYKRRITLPYRDAEQLLAGKGFPTHLNTQIALELAYFVERNGVRPKIFLAYDREARLLPSEPGLRITFDSGLRYRYQNLTLAAPQKNTLFADTPFYLMEIKSPRAVPLALAAYLTQEKIFPVSFSKYGKIYQKETLAANPYSLQAEGEKECLKASLQMV